MVGAAMERLRERRGRVESRRSTERVIMWSRVRRHHSDHHQMRSGPQLPRAGRDSDSGRSRVGPSYPRKMGPEVGGPVPNILHPTSGTDGHLEMGGGRHLLHCLMDGMGMDGMDGTREPSAILSRSLHRPPPPPAFEKGSLGCCSAACDDWSMSPRRMIFRSLPTPDQTIRNTTLSALCRAFTISPIEAFASTANTLAHEGAAGGAGQAKVSADHFRVLRIVKPQLC